MCGDYSSQATMKKHICRQPGRTKRVSYYLITLLPEFMGKYGPARAGYTVKINSSDILLLHSVQKTKFGKIASSFRLRREQTHSPSMNPAYVGF